jgi:predicted XRE-type DNA-binding protein
LPISVFPNAEEHQLKAALVVQLGRLIKERELSQVDAAKLLGVKQPDLSNILRGHYRGYSPARLMPDADRIRPGAVTTFALSLKYNNTSKVRLATDRWRI